jgi:citrate lyase subunit beta/citryl-CoA lyase
MYGQIMVPTPLIRSLLFAPANRPDLLRKLPRHGADAYVIDLEDGTPETDKETARAGLARAVDELRAAGLEAPLFVRINAMLTPHAERDIAAACGPQIDGVMVPKLNDRADMRAVETAVARTEDATGRGLGVIGLIETAAGVLNADRLARRWNGRLIGLAFGAEDFVTDIGGRRRADSREVFYAQVGLANDAFSPSPEEVEGSRRLIRAHTEAKNAGRGAIEFVGGPVDEPMLRRAEAVVARRTEGAALR